MSASITREFMYYPAGTRTQGLDDDTDGAESFDEAPLYRHYYALKNRLNFYGLRSVHHKVIGTASMGGAVDRWNKDDQQINLISILVFFISSFCASIFTVVASWQRAGDLPNGILN